MRYNFAIIFGKPKNSLISERAQIDSYCYNSYNRIDRIMMAEMDYIEN